MSSSASELVERLSSDDFNERARSLAALVGLGRDATPALLEALEHGDEPLRIQAARALSETGDPAGAEALATAAGDESGEVRGYAAMGLARIGDPRATGALVRAIDDLPDQLHYPYTGPVYALIDLGATALPAVAPLLDAEAPTTRQRAFVVIRSVVSNTEDWTTLWEELGRYDPEGASPERTAAAAQWARWIASR